MARARAPELFPLFRSRTQAELLAHLLMSPERERTTGDIADAIEAPLSTVSRELDRLVRVGILTERRLGRTRLVQPDPDSPLVPPLTEIVLRTFGPLRVIEEEFQGIAGVAEIWIFGSWAARYAGRPGPPPADVDVLVVGRPDRAAMDDAAQRAESRLGRPVNTTVRSMRRWHEDPDNFVQQLHEAPLVPINMKGTRHSATG